MVFSFVIFAREAGMVPVRLLAQTRSTLRQGGKSARNWPTRLLFETSNTLRFEQFAELGIFSCSMLLFKCMVWRRRKWPSDGGISPVSVFSDKANDRRNDRFPSKGDMCPTKCRLVRFREITRREAFTLHMTPSQLQKWVLSFQDMKTCWRSKRIASLNPRSDSQSVSFPYNEEDMETISCVLQATNTNKSNRLVVVMSMAR
jgi:hypothetical protein